MVVDEVYEQPEVSITTTLIISLFETSLVGVEVEVDVVAEYILFEDDCTSILLT